MDSPWRHPEELSGMSDIELKRAYSSARQAAQKLRDIQRTCAYVIKTVGDIKGHEEETNISETLQRVEKQIPGAERRLREVDAKLRERHGYNPYS